MNKFEIFDKKNSNSQVSYSNYKKSDVKKKFTDSLKNKELDNSIHFAVELDMSGEQEYIWNQIIYLYCDYINISNSAFIIFFYKRYFSFFKYTKKIYDNKYDYRNSLKMRNHLIELISTFLLSNYNSLPKLPTISTKHYDFKNHTLLCKELTDINDIILINDSKDIIIPCNEILYILKLKDNLKYKNKCLFWINWLFNWDKKFNKNLVMRKIDNVDSKYHYSIHWIIWEIIFYCIIFKKSDILVNKIKCLFYFFKLNYKKQSQKNKLLVVAILLIFENKKYNDLNFYNEYDTILKSVMNVNYFYNQVHKNKIKYENNLIRIS